MLRLPIYTYIYILYVYYIYIYRPITTHVAELASRTVATSLEAFQMSQMNPFPYIDGPKKPGLWARSRCSGEHCPVMVCSDAYLMQQMQHQFSQSTRKNLHHHNISQDHETHRVGVQYPETRSLPPWPNPTLRSHTWQSPSHLIGRTDRHSPSPFQAIKYAYFW